MSFEAVPCMFRSTANDGNSSSYIGLLIRPSGSAATPLGAGTAVNATVVGGNATTGPKSLHVVPTSLKTATVTPQTQKVVVPTGVQLRLQPAATVCANNPQCSDAWIHPAARPPVNSTFDSPSPSQVVPQMNVGDSYECSVPCASSSSFFPPISSITQSLSSAKSDLDLLQEMSSVEMSNVLQGDKIVSTNNEYVHSTTPQQYHASSLHGIYPAPPQTEIAMGRLPSCRYQSGYNGANDCAATPDSGIQSIAGSPPSTGPFTPPMPSPAPCIPLAAGDLGDASVSNGDASTSSEDFSDMPRLIPFHQTEDSSTTAPPSPPLDDRASVSSSMHNHDLDRLPAPSLCKSTLINDTDLHRVLDINMVTEQKHEQHHTDASCMEATTSMGTDSVNRTPSTGRSTGTGTQPSTVVVTSTKDIPKIAITPAMNVNELVEQLISHMDPEQRKQLATVIKSKVETCEHHERSQQVAEQEHRPPREQHQHNKSASSSSSSSDSSSFLGSPTKSIVLSESFTLSQCIEQMEQAEKEGFTKSQSSSPQKTSFSSSFENSHCFETVTEGFSSDDGDDEEQFSRRKYEEPSTLVAFDDKKDHAALSESFTLSQCIEQMEQEGFTKSQSSSPQKPSFSSSFESSQCSAKVTEGFSSYDGDDEQFSRRKYEEPSTLVAFDDKKDHAMVSNTGTKCRVAEKACGRSGGFGSGTQSCSPVRRKMKGGTTQRVHHIDQLAVLPSSSSSAVGNQKKAIRTRKSTNPYEFDDCEEEEEEVGNEKRATRTTELMNDYGFWDCAEEVGSEKKATRRTELMNDYGFGDYKEEKQGSTGHLEEERHKRTGLQATTSTTDRRMKRTLGKGMSGDKDRTEESQAYPEAKRYRQTNYMSKSHSTADVRQERKKDLLDNERTREKDRRERLKRKHETSRQKQERMRQLEKGESWRNLDEERVLRKREEQERKEQEESRERLRVYRIAAKRYFNKQLQVVFDQVDQSFMNLELNLGPRMHWSLPWYRLNWRDVTQRLVERDRLEKLQKERRASPKKTSTRKKLRKQTVSRTEKRQSGSLPVNGKEKERTESDGYVKIKQNVIVDTYPRIEQLQCSCQKGTCAEADGCLNRMVQMECTSTCKRVAQCTNRRLYKRECVDKLNLFHTNNGRGYGVRTDAHIHKGQLVCEYVGEVVSMETFETRKDIAYRNYKHHYALNLCAGFVIDAYHKGNLARFVNHSCAPNCEMQRWSVNGQYRMGLFTLRPISKGEELTYDYNWDAFDLYGITPCSCGVTSCRGFLNKNVVMNSREKQLARSTGVLLLRNVRKSAKRTMNRLTSSDTRHGNSSHQTVNAFVESMMSALTDSEVLSRKQQKQLNKILDETMNTSTLSLSLRCPDLFTSLDLLFTEKVDVILKTQGDKKKIQALKTRLDDIRMEYRVKLKKVGGAAAREQHVTPSNEHKKAKTTPTSSQRIITATADLSYLESEMAVGSYDADSLLHVGRAETDSDCVRCVCGITDDDGAMVQCDACHFWLHQECVLVASGAADFKCDMCRWKASRTPALDIVLRSQPQIKFKPCVYYRTLVNVHSVQVRINETVYVRKLTNDNHKAELKRLNETWKGAETSSVGMCTSTPHSAVASRKSKPTAYQRRFHAKAFERKDVRCFRVERLFSSPQGQHFVFGFYYARPHEVYCEPGRMFHEKEVFATQMFDTLPLDAVIGRCLVLEPRIYVLGRPKMPRYHEADVYFCEYQTGKNSRYFEKIPSRNHYYINSEPHNFVRFSIEPSLNRSFTPFIMERHAEGDSEGSSQRSPPSGSASRKIHDHKRARLETILSSLTHRSPPRKIPRHSSRQ